MAVPVTIVDKNGVPTTIINVDGQAINFGDYVEKSSIDQPNGVAGLDASGKIATAQMPVGDVVYIGNWNAATNTPTLANGVGGAGDLHICDVAGSQNLGAGVVAYGVGDWLIYDGTVWDRVPATGAAPANPSVTVGLTAKNGTAATFMRSDAAPALDQAIVPTWTGAHTFTQTMTTAAITSSGAITSTSGVAGNTTVTAGIGSNSVQMDGAPNGQDVKIRALGVTDANVSLALSAKGTGLLKMASPMTVAGALTVTGEVSAANGAGVASPTNSGIVLAKAPNWGMAQFYDADRTANNRSMDILFIGDGLHMRFVNDARNAFLDFLSVQGGQATGVTGIASTSGSGAWTHTGAFALAGNNSTIMVGGLAGTPGQVLTSTGNATTPAWSNVTAPVASDGKTAQAANINAPSLYAVPTSGLYRVSSYIVISQAATTSSTMPSVTVEYTDATISAALSELMTNTSTANTAGTHLGGSAVISAQQGTNIGYVTAGYASSGATAMQYAVHMNVEFLG